MEDEEVPKKPVAKAVVKKAPSLSSDKPKAAASSGKAPSAPVV
jgi:hypothetical protein